MGNFVVVPDMSPDYDYQHPKGENPKDYDRMVPPPKGMTQDDWDKKVIGSGNDQVKQNGNMRSMPSSVATEEISPEIATV